MNVNYVCKVKYFNIENEKNKREKNDKNENDKIEGEEKTSFIQWLNDQDIE